MAEIKVIKKNGKVVDFDGVKIKEAITKSAERANIKLKEDDKIYVSRKVKLDLEKQGKTSVTVLELHGLVMDVLSEVSEKAAESYRSYRNYKENFVDMMDEVLRKYHNTRYFGDRSNANADSSLVSTQRSILCGEIAKEIYKKFYLSPDELDAINDGYIYIHDLTHRLTGSFNCCISDAGAIIKGGFEMGNVWYNEPKTISSACAVLGDVIMSASSNHYGGHTVKVDDVLAPYCEKSYDMYIKEYIGITLDIHAEDIDLEEKAKEYAKHKTIKDLEQGLQGLEYKLNTLVSARGDFLFTTFAFGDNFTEWGKQVTRSILKVRKEGQGRPGFKRNSVFPKLTMFYRNEWYGEGAPYEFIFDEAIDCSSQAMYPDYTSLEPTSSIGETYEKWGAPTCSMG